MLPRRRNGVRAAVRPGQLAAGRIGPWPGNRVSAKPQGLARQHAAGVWLDAQTGMVNRAERLWRHVDGDQTSFEGQVDLAFLATVGAHLERCTRCWQTWIDGEVPVELLTAAVRRIPAWEVYRVLLREIRAQRGPGRAGGLR